MSGHRMTFARIDGLFKVIGKHPEQDRQHLVQDYTAWCFMCLAVFFCAADIGNLIVTNCLSGAHCHFDAACAKFNEFP